MGIRRATRQDIPRIMTLAGRLFAEDSGTHDPHADVDWPTSPEGRRYYAHHVADDGACVLVAGDPADGFLVGVLRPHDPLRPGIVVADLQSMYVVPERRSGGAGRALAAAFRGWAQERGVDVLTVTASVANSGARRFYRSLGFDEQAVTYEASLR